MSIRFSLILVACGTLVLASLLLTSAAAMKNPAADPLDAGCPVERSCYP